MTDASGNFTGSQVRVSDTPGAANAVGFSSTLAGNYDLIGGVNATVNATSITTSAPAVTGLTGFYVMSTKSDPPVLSGLAITPTGNQCTNVTRTVSVTVTPGAAAVSTVVINYSVNGTPQSAVSMTNTSGNNWSGTIPTVSPANANVTWSVTATDANTITATQTGTAYKDEPNTGITANATATVTNLCNGGSSSLNVTLAGLPSAAIGTGTTTNTATTYPAPFGNYWWGARTQMLITKAELNAAGYSAGTLTSVAFDVVSPITTPLTGFSVGMKATSLTAMGTSMETGFTTVYSVATYTPSTSAGYANNKITFSTPFNWMVIRI